MERNLALLFFTERVVPVVLPAALKRGDLFLSAFPIYLPRACLGKIIIFIHKWLKKPVFSPETRRPSRQNRRPCRRASVPPAARSARTPAPTRSRRPRSPRPSPPPSAAAAAQTRSSSAPAPADRRQDNVAVVRYIYIYMIHIFARESTCTSYTQVAYMAILGHPQQHAPAARPLLSRSDRLPASP